MANLSTTTQEAIGNKTPDGLVVNATKISLYAGSTPVVQAANIASLTAADTTTNICTAVNAILAAIGYTGIGITTYV